MGRVTIKTLARELGLSICTINKALTGKPRISEETRRRVVEAAARLGYHPNQMARRMVRPVIKIGVVHPDAWPSHYQRLAEGVYERIEELRDFRIAAEVQARGDFRDGAGFLRSLKRVVRKGAAGLILSPGDFQESEMDLLREFLFASRLPTILLGNDLPSWPRECCVSHDASRCGRLAAELLTMMGAAGATAILLGSLRISDHQKKHQGLIEGLRAAGNPDPWVGEAHDDPKLAFETMERLLACRPDLKGLYIATENGAEAGRFLACQGLAGRIKAVATGLSPEVVAFMRQGIFQALLGQNQRQQGREAVDTLFKFLEGSSSPPKEILIPPSIIVQNNLDLHLAPSNHPNGQAGPERGRS